MVNDGVVSEDVAKEFATAIVRITGPAICLLVGAPSRLIEVEQLYCSTHKAAARLWWEPAVTLDQQLNRTTAWF